MGKKTASEKASRILILIPGIEPWCGSADFDDCTGVFAEKRGIAVLHLGEEKAFTYSITAKV